MVSIDTSGKFCSISISSSDNIKYSIISKKPLSHSIDLGVNLNKILTKYNISIKDLDFIAINIGPGSFTGLRIGVSFAKGLCLSNNIPLIPINSFEIIDSKIKCEKDIFYYGVYSHKNFFYGVQYVENIPSTPRLMNLENRKDGPIYIFGLEEKAQFGNDIIHIDYNSSDLIDIALEKNQNKSYDDLNSIHPIYIDYNETA